VILLEDQDLVGPLLIKAGWNRNSTQMGAGDEEKEHADVGQNPHREPARIPTCEHAHTVNHSSAMNILVARLGDPKSAHVKQATGPKSIDGPP